MSIDNFTFAEDWHYDHDTEYRISIRTQLRERGLALRRPAPIESHAHEGIDASVMAKGRAKGHMPTRPARRCRTGRQS